MGLPENSGFIPGSTRVLLGGTPEIRFLSLWQPWAWLVVHGDKDLENRDQAWKYRGRIVVHAALTIDDAAMLALPRRGVYVPRTINTAAANGADHRNELVTGGIVGRADIVDCVQESASQWFFGPNGLVLAERKPLPFFRCRGHVGLQRPAPEILAFYQGLL